MRSNKLFLACTMSVAVAISLAADSSTSETDAVLDTIAQMNHMNWVVTKIKNYNNALVLEEEYEKISPGMLNLNRIPDKETLDKIIALLDELHAMRKSEREMKFWRDHFDAERRQRQIDFWKSRLAEANLGNMITGALRVNLADPTAMLEMGKAVASTTLDEWSAYTRLMSDLEKEVDKKIFDFDTAKLEAMHRRNKEMLQDQWGLIRKYRLDDSLRVAESDLLALIEILKDPNPAHVYPRIEPLKSRFPTFPVYWYYLSTAALEAKEYEAGIAACDMFFKVNRGLFRDDPMRGIVALNKAVMLEKIDENKSEVRRCLDECRRHTALKPDWRRDYMCASLYAGFLKDRETALLTLKRAMATLANNVRCGIDALRQIASSDDTSIRHGEAEFPDGDALIQCLRLYREIESGSDISTELENFSSLGAVELTSPVERLELVGRLSADKIWSAIENDIENLALECNTTVRKTGTVSWKLNAEISARFPVRWFLSGGFKVEVVLMDGSHRIAVLSEDKKRRRAVTGDCIELQFPVNRDKLSGVDSFVLEFKHPRYPSSMTFASRTPYLDEEYAKVVGNLSLAGKLAADKLCDDLSLYEISLCGKMLRRNIDQTNKLSFSESVSDIDWQKGFAKVFKNLYKGTNGGSFKYVANISCEADGLTILYENKEEHVIKPKVSVFLLSRYGAVLGRIDDIWFFQKLAVGAKGKSNKFAFPNMGKVAYIDVECE